VVKLTCIDKRALAFIRDEATGMPRQNPPLTPCHTAPGSALTFVSQWFKSICGISNSDHAVKDYSSALSFGLDSTHVDD